MKFRMWTSYAHANNSIKFLTNDTWFINSNSINNNGKSITPIFMRFILPIIVKYLIYDFDNRLENESQKK